MNNKIFELVNFNATNGMYTYGSSTDPTLALGTLNTKDINIRGTISRISATANTFLKSDMYNKLKDDILLEKQNLKSLTILRIYKNDNNFYDIYVKLVIADKEYWGKIVNFLSLNPKFTSELFKDKQLHITKEWSIRISGKIINIINSWMCVDNGTYVALKDNIIAHNAITGNVIVINKNDEIKVVNCFENIIVATINNKTIHLKNESFIYFNYWFNIIN